MRERVWSRSVLVASRLAGAILLSIGASLGILVAIFQWGWLSDLVGVNEEVPIVIYLPVMMLAILFGLSMDYDVFILSRVREAYARTGEARAASSPG